MSDSIHDKLKRVRKPRVHITYDLETNGSIVEKEIPFVMGVMGDYSGDNTEGKKALKDRKFSQIDRDNFNEIMTKVNPQLRVKVENLLENDGSEMTASLDFKTMEDFEPHRIVEQLEPLKKLMDTRNKLRDLLTKADRSEDLEAILEDVLSNTNALSSLSSELGVSKKEE
ncbi:MULTISPECIES: type VI secretion system contractile sheath small subunit [unclassified Cellvibrio]|jgi:type VI secretion system protein ImpB|uniref:type VI secretion system contractile sheath small subunit n=1 Tax=unclassified Cellvibrio TaxID=2624793 RepID=UPI0002E86761|nr:MULTISPECIES: type VI secretion system contractile sheath small subunit [unclassified Cellvibrio]UUA75063.1 type VI secretion system contractile sheath small subunit [Cellvibrio sp. QJXJ]